MLSENDKILLEEKGITEDKLAQQLDCFKKGFPYLRLAGAASPEKGILVIDDEDKKKYISLWQEAAHELDVVKFVPASGAASRMFKDLFAFMSAERDAPQTEFEHYFFDHIEDFAFAEALNDACMVCHQESLDQLIDDGRYKDVVGTLLGEEGLDYGALPKGLLLFHSYADAVRTPAEEHLVEGAMYAKDKEGQVKVHFTVSPEHEEWFETLMANKLEDLEKTLGVKFSVSFSQQKESTDTVAATPDNLPFRSADGALFFRPGGHGALIENLNDIVADIIFIKNIDNVVPDWLKPTTADYKAVIGGVLIEAQRRIFDAAKRLDARQYDDAALQEMLQWVEKTLCCYSEVKHEGEDLANYLRQKLNRPIRVCGMVRNVGEPGGGPFLAYNPDGSISLQILESSQIDMHDAEKKEMFEKGTHFNPVDIVCGVKDYKGQKYDLRQFVDPATGFISQKSKNGQPLQALELPGLWNGAMSNWNTIFVEVPLATFNPVKTVNDLLRKEHRPQ